MRHFLLIKQDCFRKIKSKCRLTIVFLIFFQWVGIARIAGQDIVITYDNKEITIENNTNAIIVLFGGGSFDEKALKNAFSSKLKIDVTPFVWCGSDNEFIQIQKETVIKNTNCAPVEESLKLYAIKKTQTTGYTYRLTEVTENIEFKKKVIVNETVPQTVEENKPDTNKITEAVKVKDTVRKDIIYKEQPQTKQKTKPLLPEETNQSKEKKVFIALFGQKIKKLQTETAALEEECKPLLKKYRKENLTSDDSLKLKSKLNACISLIETVAKEQRMADRENYQTPVLQECLSSLKELKKSLEEATATSVKEEKVREIQETHEPQESNNLMSFLIIGVLLIPVVIGIVFYIRTYLKNRKIEKSNSEKKDMEGSGLILEEEEKESVSCIVDISDIQEKTGSDYYEINMRAIFDDTAIETVYFSRQCILDIYKFFSNFLKLEKKTEETGCFIVGRWDYTGVGEQTYNISLETIVEPSDDAVYKEYELHFGAKIGIGTQYEIARLREETGKEYVHTAWMHSHPGLGLFLSNQDISAQSQLTYSKHPLRMLAIVVDSNTEDLETAFFTPKQGGVMNNNLDLKRVLSLDTLYQWAKKRPSSSKSDIQHSKANKQQGYYDIPVRAAKSKISAIFFSGAAIIEMDEAIVPGQAGLQGYFPYRENPEDKSIFIDKFQAEDKTGAGAHTPLGCLFVVQRFSYNEILENNRQMFDRFDFLVFYCAETEDIYVISKELSGKYPERESGIASSSLMEMKKWTRRRRE